MDEYYDHFAQISQARLIAGAISNPRASRVGFLAADQLIAGETIDPATAAPLYVRASEAEINLKKKEHSSKPD